ncbi:hypothetical protein AB2B41_07060 [Marimonas sp. MJW-29]|uniref:Uncharacterized protein n=1 Tax=Sulfitobacter sediminis TaxID=3234186 RepID=A0ABV3RK53_9RHOB
MSKWLALANVSGEKINSPPDNMTKPDKTPSIQPEGAFCQVLSNCQEEDVRKIVEPVADDMRHGFTVNGSPKTWTGKIMSLDDWRKLSDWQKHGPDGRMWCGACREWVSNCAHV